MTTTICTDLRSGTSTPFRQIPPSVHLVAVGGTFDGATVELFANVGVTVVPLGAWTEPGARLIWFPRCTVFAEITDQGAKTSLNAAAAPVAEHLTPRDSYARLELIGVI